MASTVRLKTLFMYSKERFFASSIELSGHDSGGSALPFAVEYLMKNCGLPLDSALSTASKLRKFSREDTRKLDSVIDFLKSCGLKKTQIATVVGKQPLILHASVDRTLRPKVQFLGEVGLPRDLIVDMVVRNPQMMHRSLDAHIRPRYKVLLEYFGDVETLKAALWRCSRLLVQVDKGCFQKNFECLIREGVPAGNVSKVMELQPRVLLQSNDWMVLVTKFVKGLGFDPTTPLFGHAISVMASMTEAGWNKKIGLFNSLGWSQEDIFSMFRRQPYCMASSEDKLRRVVDFFVNTVKIEVKDLVNRPHLLLYGIDKRLYPRYNVIKVLASKNLLSKKKNILTILDLPEKKFLEDYVLRNIDEVPELMDIHRGVDAVDKSS